jgi:surfeit locus 1 family protein
VNATLKRKLLGLLPYAIGTILVVQFGALGVWQIDRGLTKKAERAAFASGGGFARWIPGSDFRSFQKLEVSGKFDTEHQFLLENIIIDSRIGDYVVTPLVIAGDEPVLLVNRGWIERHGPGATTLAVESARVTVRGRAGSLPRAGYRMGDAVTPGSGWPKTAVYPTLGELAAELGRDVQPFVLLLDPEESYGYYRFWVPQEMGPARHFAYALQWFAMGAALAGLLVWNYRKRGLES